MHKKSAVSGNIPTYIGSMAMWELVPSESCISMHALSQANKAGCLLRSAVPALNRVVPPTLAMQGDGSMTRESLHFDVDTAIRVRGAV